MSSLKLIERAIAAGDNIIKEIADESTSHLLRFEVGIATVLVTGVAAAAAILIGACTKAGVASAAAATAASRAVLKALSMVTVLRR